MQKKIKYVGLILILFTIGSCGQLDKESKELDLSQPKNVAEIFSKAFVKQDSTLLQRILLDKREFTSFPTAKDFGNTYEDYILNIYYDFEDSKNLTDNYYKIPFSANSDYELIETDVKDKIDYVKYYFELVFDDEKKIGFKIYLIKTSYQSWKLARLVMETQ